jgi:hypothetical protein
MILHERFPDESVSRTQSTLGDGRMARARRGLGERYDGLRLLVEHDEWGVDRRQSLPGWRSQFGGWCRDWRQSRHGWSVGLWRDIGRRWNRLDGRIDCDRWRSSCPGWNHFSCREHQLGRSDCLGRKHGTCREHQFGRGDCLGRKHGTWRERQLGRGD